MSAEDIESVDRRQALKLAQGLRNRLARVAHWVRVLVWKAYDGGRGRRMVDQATSSFDVVGAGIDRAQSRSDGGAVGVVGGDFLDSVQGDPDSRASYRQKYGTDLS
jgi:hypothetical protein